MKAITANDLIGGHVVFFATGGTWSKYIEDAAIFSDNSALESALALVKRDEERQIIVGAYEIDVTLENNVPSPTKLREKIRAAGPTTAYGDGVSLQGFYAA